MRDIAYYRFCHSWLRGLLKSNEPPALAKRWSFHGPRGMDEVKRSICLPESMAPTTEFSLVPKQAQAHKQKPLTLPLVNRSALNCAGGSLREDKGCMDTQRAGNTVQLYLL